MIYIFWRDVRVVEGGGLENHCTVKCCTEGSNPSLSAIYKNLAQARFLYFKKYDDHMLIF